MVRKGSASVFSITPMVNVKIGDDIDACRNAMRPAIALYVGGMGARDKNFYNNLVSRMGWEDAAREIQDLYLDGKKKEAMGAVPDDLIDAICLVGPKERVAERVAAWKRIDGKRRSSLPVPAGRTCAPWRSCVS